MKIIFQNKHWIVIDKDPLVLSVPSRQGVDDQRLCAGIELQNNLKKKIYPVHRLDFEVSGLLIFALDSEAHRWSQTIFESKKIRKTYQALSENREPPNIQVGQKYFWESKLLRGKKRSYEHPLGKESLTEAKLEATDHEYSYWTLIPHTGRSHQLRFEMYKHHSPIVGDKLYNSSKAWKQGIALRAHKIEFLTPPLFDLAPIIEIPGLF